MNIFTQFSTKLLALTFSAAIVLVGCNNPASNDDDDHSIPHGIEFVLNGETIVTYPGDSTEGVFDVEEGQETSLITAKFLNEDGNEIHGEDFDDEYYLAWEIGNTEIADIEQQEEDRRWSFRIVGKAAGETNVQFLLWHGDDHDEYKTPTVDNNNAISIHVQEPSQ